ncbi:MAG TPA: hypothetical protein VM451_05890 [Candidatus Limnocylindria bacterium]|nr:hypothetical protein [Candidatus Limnocylindria bacterium]
MTRVLRVPWLLFAFLVERLRRLPGARFIARVLPAAARLMVVAAIVLLLLWMAEASPQRMSLAELRAGQLSRLQTWIIVSGQLSEEPGTTSESHRYRLTDPATPNTQLNVRSDQPLPLGPATVSGRILGGRDGVPEGYTWAAQLDADPVLASELPPPGAAFALLGLAVVIFLARRSAYPMFLNERPADVPAARSGMRVTTYFDPVDAAARGLPRDSVATLGFDRPEGAALGDLRLSNGRSLPVRLNSIYTTIDVGRLQSLGRSEPVLRVRVADDDVALAFATRRDRDAAYAALALAVR